MTELQALGGPGSGRYPKGSGHVGGSVLSSSATVIRPGQKFDIHEVGSRRFLYNPNSGHIILGKELTDARGDTEGAHGPALEDALKGNHDVPRRYDLYRVRGTLGSRADGRSGIFISEAPGDEVDRIDAVENFLGRMKSHGASSATTVTHPMWMLPDGVDEEFRVHGYNQIRTLLRALGGPGSGNHGHAGRPGQVGGSSTIAFHGTVSEKIDLIKKEGLKRLYSGAVHPDLSRPSVVYVTTDRQEAQGWAAQAARKLQLQSVRDGLGYKEFVPAVVEIYIPKKEAGYLRSDRNILAPGENPRNWEFARDIDPKWVKSVLIRDEATGWRTAAAAADVDVFYIATVLSDNSQLRDLGGPGSGRYPKGSGQNPRGGGGNPYSPDVSADAVTEAAHQQELADAQSDPLAHPEFVLGGSSVPGSARYVAAYGQKFEPAKLPADVKRATPGECYKNASLLVMSRPDLTYVEGFATTPAVTSLTKAYGDLNKPGLTFQHAWAVGADGKVIDPTWDHPEKNQYFGVKYERKAYLKYLYTAKIYGVLGSTRENAKKAVSTGAPLLRSGLKTLGFRALWPNKDGVDLHGRAPSGGVSGVKTKAPAKAPAAAQPPIAGDFTRSSRPEELAAHSKATLDALDKKTAQPQTILSLKENPATRAALIKTLGGEARAQAEYAHTPTADLAVLKSIKVENKPVSGQAHCTWNREVVMGSTSVSGDFRHELGHAVHMSMSPELQGRAKKLFDVAKAKVKANPAGLQQKLTHEFYEKTYGVIGRRGLDNWHENFAEHYRGYHKAVFQTQSGEDKGALTRYATLHPDWNALWDARYSTVGSK